MIQKFVVSLFVLLAAVVLTAENIEGNFFHDGIYRDYILHVPPQHNGTDSVPLVINMHGYTSSSQGQMDYSRMNFKADAEGFLVCYPNGTGSGDRAWNAGMCCGNAVGSGIDDVGFISALIDTIMEDYVVDTLRIFATGMSNGGMMSHRLACELSDRIAAVAPVAGGLVLEDFDDCQPERSVPVIHFHAVDDAVVPYNGGIFGDYYFPSLDSVMRTWARKDSCDLGPDTTEIPGAFLQVWSRSTDEGPPVEVHFWTTPDGGHTWPGSANGTQAIIANDLMWDFFTAHPMPADEDDPDPGIDEGSIPLAILDPANPGIISNAGLIRFSLAQTGNVSIILYDALGRSRGFLLDTQVQSGSHTVSFDASKLSAGIYFYRLVTLSSSETGHLVIVR